MDNKIKRVDWTVKDSDTNAALSAEQLGETGVTHVITGFMASFSASTASGLLEVKSEGTVIAEYYVHGAAHIQFTHPLPLTKGDDAEITLAAGGAGVLGKCTLFGYSEYK